MQRSIAFRGPEREAVLAGTKTATRRRLTASYESIRIGDTFELSGRLFKIIEIGRQAISTLSITDAAEEGFKSVDQMKQRLAEIYPYLGPDEILIAFRFREVQRATLVKHLPGFNMGSFL